MRGSTRVEGPNPFVLSSEMNLRPSQFTSNRQHLLPLLTSNVSSIPLASRSLRVQCPLVALLALCFRTATRVAHSRILYRTLSLLPLPPIYRCLSIYTRAVASVPHLPPCHPCAALCLMVALSMFLVWLCYAIGVSRYRCALLITWVMSSFG